MTEKSPKTRQKNQKPTRAALLLIWEQLRKHPVAIALMLIMVALDSLVYIAEPYILKLFVDNLNVATPTSETYSQAWKYIGMMLAVYIFGQVTFHIGARSLIFAEVNVINGLYKRAFQYLQHHSVKFFSESFAGALVKRLTRAVESAETILDQIWFTFLPVALRLSFMLIVLAFYSPPMFVVLLVGVIIFIGFTSVMLNRWAPMEQDAVANSTALSAVLVDSISNNLTVKSFAQEDSEFDRVSATADTLKAKQYKSWRYFWVHINFPQGWIWTFFVIGILAASLYLWQIGRFTVGDIVFIQTYIFTLGPILWESVNRFHDFKKQTVNTTELITLLDQPHDVQDIPDATTLTVPDGKIHFDNVTFSYAERTIFDGLDLTIKAGERVAFVGHSGSGKSTLIKLLFRFYDITSGAITIDGQNIAKVSLQSLRHQIGLVPQDPLLFHRSIRENIAYGKSDATLKDIMHAAQKAHADEFISQMLNGYDTTVGERGVKLSGGERQRVAIARAFLEDARIVVFDEATSSLDSMSEKFIQDALDELMKDRTIIVIAHRLSTIVKMDRIVVFSKGKIVEQGTHTELLAMPNGHYKALWDIQTQKTI